MTSLDQANGPNIIDESAEHRFRRYFPYNTRLSHFSADEQFELLYRAYLLCVKSNRRKEIKINQRIPDHSFVARSRNGRCCHPIFISQSTFKVKRFELQQPDVIYELLFTNAMLSSMNQQRTPHERHPTYCEEFRHGDLLTLVVPDEFQAETNRHRVVNPFEVNEGVFVWLVTKKMPWGYPAVPRDESEAPPSLFDFEI